jgi:hypothetical protein
MSDKPTSAGLWTREGKFYRVWHDGETAKMIGQHIDGDTGFTGGLIWNLPTGNWRKITAGTAPAPPEVIEGRGQVVTAEQAGQYWGKDGNAKAFYCTKCEGGEFMKGTRYMRISEPTFPPRPAFVSPEKPEPKYRLYRITQGDSKGNTFWGLPASNGAELFICNEPDYFNSEWCEEIDETTGEPLATKERRKRC